MTCNLWRLACLFTSRTDILIRGLRVQRNCIGGAMTLFSFKIILGAASIAAISLLLGV